MANRLINEQSPYLLQHAHNPVDWYAWGDEAFERAKYEHKPVLVSIGYSACHWCHVMERESFENAEVAAYMNEHFICIKVDREEHPDVDHLYMDAVQAISGSGGWPLNVFVTPGRVPFYGGTYFPPRPAFNRPSWPQLLQRMNDIWTQQQDEVTAQTEQMLQYLRQAGQPAKTAGVTRWDMDSCSKMAETLLKQADTVHGGFGAAPKFPGTMAISFLLEHYHFTKYEPALKQALLSLDKMIDGGIYDQIGGGFARYATDTEWLVPHFEKMLYDNALLICALCDAYYITHNERYKIVIEDTIAFVERELKDQSGLYYSALDADSEGVEGKFYTWTWEEWKEVFETPDEAVAAYFGVSEHGNWEETNILHVPEPIEKVAVAHKIEVAELQEKIKTAKEQLLQKRAGRIRPQTDDKSLLAWNALMNIALSKAAVAFGEDAYLERAAMHMDKMLEQYWQYGELMHTWKKGTAKINAKLDDYAYLIQALLQLATSGGSNSYIEKAEQLTKQVKTDFINEDGNFFYYTSIQQKDIPVRKVDLYDGAVPSANAVMAGNLLQLGLFIEQSEYTEQAVYMMSKMADTAMRYIYSFGYWAQQLQRYAAGVRVVVIAEAGGRELRKELQKRFLPQCFLLNSEKEIFEVPVLENKFFEGKDLIFVCTEEACLPPAGNVEGALKLIAHV